jgi:hypothetical protein
MAGERSQAAPWRFRTDADLRCGFPVVRGKVSPWSSLPSSGTSSSREGETLRLRAPGADDAADRLSRLADNLHSVAELDLNPVLALPTGCVAVDARVRVAR